VEDEEEEEDDDEEPPPTDKRAIPLTEEALTAPAGTTARPSWPRVVTSPLGEYVEASFPQLSTTLQMMVAVDDAYTWTTPSPVHELIAAEGGPGSTVSEAPEPRMATDPVHTEKDHPPVSDKSTLAYKLESDQTVLPWMVRDEEPVETTLLRDTVKAEEMERSPAAAGLPN
jgi:hypothetical protein